MAKVADPLRLYAEELYANDIIPGMQLKAMNEIAGQIDRDHERRMEQCRHETKRATMRYLNSVIVDYMKHDMKRSRADMLARYERKKKK